MTRDTSTPIEHTPIKRMSNYEVTIDSIYYATMSAMWLGCEAVVKCELRRTCIGFI